MRLFILAAATALVLAACGANDPSDASGNAGESLTADNIVSNDVTAIDAVTGDAANMAADVNYTADLDNSLDNETNSSAPATRPRPKSSATRPERATEPAANTTE